MKNRTVYSSAFVVLVAVTCSSGCYRTVATVSIDKANKFVVTEVKAKEGEVPSVVETEDGGQVLQVNEKQRVEIKARNREAPVDGLSLKSPKTLSLNTGSELTIEDKRGGSSKYLSDDIAQISVTKYDTSALKVGLGVWFTATGVFIMLPGLVMLGEPELALTTLAMGAVFLAPGIPLWAVGKRGIIDVNAYHRKLKKIGIGLTIFGIVSTLTSVGIYIIPSIGSEIKPHIIEYGIVAFCTAPLAIGIPMWVINKRRMERGEQKSTALLTPTVLVSPETNTYGLGLRWSL